jgi:hypothetical protein
MKLYQKLGILKKRKRLHEEAPCTDCSTLVGRYVVVRQALELTPQLEELLPVGQDVEDLASLQTDVYDVRPIAHVRDRAGEVLSFESRLFLGGFAWLRVDLLVDRSCERYGLLGQKQLIRRDHITRLEKLQEQTLTILLPGYPQAVVGPDA